MGRRPELADPSHEHHPAPLSQGNPRLRPSLERRGFVVREVAEPGFCYHRRDRISGEGPGHESRPAGGAGYRAVAADGTSPRR